MSDDDASADPITGSPPHVLPRICVLGSTVVVEAGRGEHVTIVASRLAPILRRQALVLIDGQAGLQDTFAQGLGEFNDIFCVLPPDESDASPKVVRRSLNNGPPAFDGECSRALSEIGDVYLVADGSAETVRQVSAALLRGALVLPLDSDACADLPLPKPDMVPEAQWAVLTTRPRAPEAVDAIVEVVSRRVLGSSVVDALADMLSRKSSVESAPVSTEMAVTIDAAEEGSDGSLADWQHSVPAVVVSLLVPLAYILF